ASEWTAPHHAAVEIDLSAWALPRYTFFSLSRGLIAYLVSLIFTLVYGYWAAKDKLAARVLIPLLDILQSIPVLAFLPGLVLALGAAFPRSNIGLELAAILMIFTGQAWNMTFSFYHSVRSVPSDQQEAATLYRFNWWQRLRWVELPFSTMGLVWNSMMSMAGGWFFLMIDESYRLGNQDFRLPGIGSYMQVAVDKGRVDAMLWAMLAMLLMIVGLDQILWRPVVVWAQKFRVEETGEQFGMSSWLLNWLRRSRLLGAVSKMFARLPTIRLPKHPHIHRLEQSHEPTNAAKWLSVAIFGLLLAVLGIGSWRLALLLRHVALHDWGRILSSGLVTLVRVIVATAAGTLWALPAGLAIGLSPRLSRIFQPIVQVAASFPAPMLFPLVIAALSVLGVSLNFGAVVLMLMGTQWYILFNVIAGAIAIPGDLRETARSYQLSLWQRLRTLYVPAVFPYLVTGWVTAAGGAWNASIVAEYVTYRGEVLQAWGLGGLINDATSRRDFPLLAASTLVMAVLVVVFNRSVWRRLYDIAERKFSLSK
ncbi:MAG TPA: ABC transporter permease subunit, partial [Lacipirellulaceae bacterium]|nr:ABC transporter permease subunit [Lacipirellulaceae bacterium]